MVDLMFFSLLVCRGQGFRVFSAEQEKNCESNFNCLNENEEVEVDLI